MKAILRKLLFAKTILYRYPYSSANLDSHLNRIMSAPYSKRFTILRGRPVAKDEFALWEKWNLFRGNSSYSALAFFSGTTILSEGKIFISALIYPRPFYVVCFYFTALAFVLMLYGRTTSTQDVEHVEAFYSLGFMSLLLLVLSMYFRWRVQRSVERELELERADQP